MYSRTVYTMLEETAIAFPHKPALQQPVGNGQYRAYTWSQVRDTVQWIAVGLRTIGVEPGDMIALQSETRAEFYVADLGVMSTGAIAAALYTALPLAEQAHALRACEAKVVLVENPKVMRGLQTALQEAADQRKWILLTGEAEGVLTLAELIAAGKKK